MGIGQCALLRQGSLVALLETAAISYATENSGDELGIVHIAEAVKQLVLFAEVESIRVSNELRLSSSLGEFP